MRAVYLRCIFLMAWLVLAAAGRMTDDIEAVLLQQGSESLPRQGMVVRNQNAFHIPLIGRRCPAD